MSADKSRPIRAILLVLGLLCLISLASHLIADGSKRGMAGAFILILLPVVAYAAATKPFVFPFSLFVLLVPFDDILRLDPRLGTLTKFMALFAGLAFVFWLVRNRRFVAPPKVLYVWLILLMWMSLSVFWAIDSGQAIERLASYAQLIALYTIITLMPVTRQDFKWVLASVVLSGVAAAAYSVYLFHTGQFIQHAQFKGILSSRLLVEFNDTKLGPDEFSATMLLPLAITLTWALQRRWSLVKGVFAAAFLLIVSGIYVNGSRGAILAVAVLIFYMILRSRFKLQLIIFSVLALAGSLLMPTSPWARFANAAATGGAGRVSIWKVGFEAFRHNWLVGAGVGNFPFAYDQNFIGIYQRYFAEWHRAPHDILIEFAVELGIIGLVLLLVGWFRQLRSLGFIDRSSEHYDLRVALEATVLALFVASLFVGTMLGKFTWLLFSVMAIMQSYLGSRRPAREVPQRFVSISPFGVHNLEPPAVKEPINAR